MLHIQRRWASSLRPRAFVPQVALLSYFRKCLETFLCEHIDEKTAQACLNFQIMAFDFDKTTMLCLNFSIWRIVCQKKDNGQRGKIQVISLSQFCSEENSAQTVKSLVIFKWFWHLIWWTKCLADGQEGFRPRHRSPQMLAMMTLNSVKTESPPHAAPSFHLLCNKNVSLWPADGSPVQSYSRSINLHSRRLNFELFRV